MLLCTLCSPRREGSGKSGTSGDHPISSHSVSENTICTLTYPEMQTQSYHGGTSSTSKTLSLKASYHFSWTSATRHSRTFTVPLLMNRLWEVLQAEARGPNPNLILCSRYRIVPRNSSQIVPGTVLRRVHTAKL